MQFLDILLHINKYIGEWTNSYGILIYGLLFLVIFCETGLVFLPFLPGDSLIFAVGALAGAGQLNIWVLFIILLVAAVLGDTVNYEIGKHFGRKIVESKKIKLISDENLAKADEFIQKHGGKAIFLARFIPVIRTIVPFVVGSGKLDYKHFLKSNAIGGFVWVILFLIIGFFFGNLPIIEDNFSLILVGIIVISVIPVFIGIINAKISKKDTK